MAQVEAATTTTAAAVVANDDPTTSKLDMNRFATKQTLAQGLLDIALLTANASQLKYVLQTNGHHPFYSLMVTLISLSIILQVLGGIFALSLNAFQDCRLHILENKCLALGLNQFQLYASFLVTGINILISAFDPSFVASPSPDFGAS